ncbi:hypothetical protein ACFQ68_00370 [Amycolatopsis japonica]|uniref:hypothetical protein n=1 Tax=Amycolatopsis japonica TaxID=208439 RepID=UPI00366FA907
MEVGWSGRGAHPDGYVAWRMDTIDYYADTFLSKLRGGIAACEAYREAADRMAA